MRFSHFGKRGQTRFPKKNGARDGGGDGSFAGLQIADFVVDEAAVPEGLVEVPAEVVAAEKLVLRAKRSEGTVELARPRETIEEAEVEEFWLIIVPPTVPPIVPPIVSDLKMPNGNAKTVV